MAQRLVNTWLVATKEWQLLATSPLLYLLSGVFVALCGFFFATRLVLYTEYAIGQNIVANFWFSFLAGAPYSVSTVLVLVIPLLTMRAFAEERRLGTLELLLTYPIRDSELLWGKFVALLVVGLGLVLIVGGYAAMLSLYVPIPWPAVLVSMAGLALLVACFTACGLFFSSLTESQLSAALATLAVLVGFWLLTWNEAAVRENWLGVVRECSAFDHFEPMARGLLTLEDVVYFLGATGLFQFLTARSLAARAWRGG